VAIEAGYVGLIAPRSGLAANHGITVLNAPGVVDSGYRGEIVVVMVNLDRTTNYHVARGDRIAQMLVVPISSIEPTEVSGLPSSPRGDSGLGRSGR
jgi:dUTP pyrophosphatase